MTEGKILLVDGMALLFRGFFATSVYGNYMYNKEGVPTNAVNGYMNYFVDALETIQPSHVICCWDMGSSTFRTKMYPKYKANRGQPPQELLPQFSMVKEAMNVLSVPNVGIEDFEADDCIGTIAKQLAPEHSIYILTGDQDMLQLIDHNIHVVIMKKGRRNYQVFDEINTLEHKGCNPQQMIDLKGLMGDTSDNYPGVKGIGEKTAMKLLKEYGTIENIIENLEQLPAGVKKKIERDEDMLFLSRSLATIREDVPIKIKPSEAAWDGFGEQASIFLEELGIRLPLLKS